MRFSPLNPRREGAFQAERTPRSFSAELGGSGISKNVGTSQSLLWSEVAWRLRFRGTASRVLSPEMDHFLVPRIPGFGEPEIVEEGGVIEESGFGFWHHPAFGAGKEATLDLLMVPTSYGAADGVLEGKRGPGRRLSLVLGLLGAVCVTTYCFGAWTDPPLERGIDASAASDTPMLHQVFLW